MRQQPHNVEGEVPTRTASEAAARLSAKMRGFRGEANRRRATAEATRLLAAQGGSRARGTELTPRNEEGQAPTSMARETAARLQEKMLRQRGGANKQRSAAKISSLDKGGVS